MMPRQVAAIGVARLGLPVPMAKLVTIQAIAAALDQDATAECYSVALAEWLGTRELESQCLEALCPLLVATPKPAMISRIRRAITRPSLASDLMLSIATGNPHLLSSWTGCHSGPVPELLTLEKEEQTLRAGTFIPPLFTHKLEALENRTGLPFLRQWSFEYNVLDHRYKNKSDGHLAYFLNSEHGNVGQFISHKGHLARSAYLRTLAFAVEHWNMPEGVAFQYAAAAIPAEPIFLRLAPQLPPSWATLVHGRTRGEADDAQALACTVIQFIEGKQQCKIMHCSLMVVDEPRYHAELEVFAVVSMQNHFDAQQVIDFYHHLLGNAAPSRDGLRAFVSPYMGNEGSKLLGFVPVVLPLVGNNVGYLQADVLGRVPYMPVSTKNLPELELVPESHGAVLRSEECEVGTWTWWLWNWKPSHPREWPTPSACCTSLTPTAAQHIADDLGGDIKQVWRLTTWRRDQEYGDWNRTEQDGRIDG